MANEAKVRTPEQILQVMDKDGVRTDANLLTLLNAELLVSLSKEADRVSRRNLLVAKIACGVAAVALLISILQLLASLAVDARSKGDKAEQSAAHVREARSGPRAVAP